MQINIPEPCHEEWAKMTPNQQGRFCDACQKCVVDFSYMTDRQILDYYNSYSENTCGRYNKSQLGRELKYESAFRANFRVYKWAAAIALFLGITQPAIAQGEGRVITHEQPTWKPAYKPEGNAQQNNIATTRPLVKDTTLKYYKFTVYTDGRRKKPYTGPLDINIFNGGCFGDDGGLVKFDKATEGNSYIVKILGQDVVQTTITLVAPANKMAEVKIILKDPTLIRYNQTPQETGILTEISLYDWKKAERRQKERRFWDKIMFWSWSNKSQLSGRYRKVDSPDTPNF